MHTNPLNMARYTLAALILPVLLLASATAASAQKRIALIIGNSAYETISPLDNPKNDADLMRQALEEVGFEVVVARDAKIRDMHKAVRTFGSKLRAAGKDAVGLFYYAGHGVQSHGTNYLIPIGAQIESDADLAIEALSASQILRQMEDAGNTLNLVILDACRNNPFKGKVRSATRGLTRINAASGTLVAFSAGPGQVAADGTSRNSPYTAALAKYIRTPNLPVEQMFKQVRIAVEDETGGRQTPWEESSLRGDFYFAGRSISVTEKPVETPLDKLAASKTLVGHRAVYNLSLDKAADEAGIANATGLLVFELTGDDCVGYSTSMRVVTRFEMNSGEVSSNDSSSDAWESARGEELRFEHKNFFNSQVTDETKGTAYRGTDDKGGAADFATPEKIVSIPPNAVFPVEHTRRLIEAARKGKPMDRTLVFDGSMVDASYALVTSIGARQNPGEIDLPDSLKDLERLQGQNAWPVEISYFTVSSDDAASEQTLSHRLSLNLLENGVSTDLTLGYEAFSLKGSLSEITFSDSRACED